MIGVGGILSQPIRYLTFCLFHFFVSSLSFAQGSSQNFIYMPSSEAGRGQEYCNQLSREIRNGGGYYTFVPDDEHPACQFITGETGKLQEASASRELQNGQQQQQQAAPAPSYMTCDDFRKFTEQCKVEANSADESSCNYKSDPGMKSVMQLANQVNGMMSVQTAASIQAACSAMGSLTTASNSALLSFKATCQIAHSSCERSCDSAAEMLKQDSSLAYRCVSDTDTMKASAKICKKAGSSLADIDFHLQSLVKTSVNAQNCAAITQGGLVAWCKARPTDSLCTGVNANVDCSNAAVASTNKVCICRANPNDTQCGTSGLVAGAVSPTAGSASGAAGADGLANPFADSSVHLGDGLDNSAADLGAINPGGTGAGAGTFGKGTGRNIGGGGGDSGGGGRAAGKGGGGAETNTKVLSGYYGGGGGGMAYGSGSQGSGGGGSYGGGPGGGQQKVDLRQFLPGGSRDPARGIAGISGPDGITGPNSSIWHKVNFRYNSTARSLKP